jgi:hypothetical protein
VRLYFEAQELIEDDLRLIIAAGTQQSGKIRTESELLAAATKLKMEEREGR